MASTLAEGACGTMDITGRVLAAEHVEQLLPARVAAAEDQRHALSRQLLAQAQAGGEGRRARALDEVPRHLDHPRLRRADLVVADQHEVVERLAEDPLRELERGARREAF